MWCTGDKLDEEHNSLVDSAAEMLYGLIHSRYILTSKGMSAMVNFSLILVFFSFYLQGLRLIYENTCLLPSWKSTIAMNLGHAQGCTAANNHVCQSVSQIFPGQVM